MIHLVDSRRLEYRNDRSRQKRLMQSDQGPNQLWGKEGHIPLPLTVTGGSEDALGASALAIAVLAPQARAMEVTVLIPFILSHSKLISRVCTRYEKGPANDAMEQVGERQRVTEKTTTIMI